MANLLKKYSVSKEDREETTEEATDMGENLGSIAEQVRRRV